MTRRPIVAAVLVLASAGLLACSEDPRNPEVDDDETIVADLLPALGTPDRLELAGRVVIEETEDLAGFDRRTPLDEWSQDEVDDAVFTLRIAGVEVEGRADDEGRFAIVIEGRGLAVGEHRWTVGPPEGEPWGEGRAVVLAADAGATEPVIVVTSDVDQTYLLTDLRKRALAGLLRADATERESFPGAPALWSALSEKHPLVFVSGSPVFFQRILMTRFRLDGVTPAGLVLKDFKGKIARLESLSSQIDYKLPVLLEQRARLPRSVVEVHLGDDTESDAVVYDLYRRIVEGGFDRDGLAAALAEPDLDLEEEKRAPILAAAEPFLAEGGAIEGAVRVAVIRLTGGEDVSAHLGPRLLAGADSLQIAIILADRGVVDTAVARRVLEAMVEAGEDAPSVRRAAREALTGKVSEEVLGGALD